MITLNEFITKYKGKGIDWDGHYGFQCVDLYRQYVQEVLELPQSPGVNGAKDIWNSYLSEHYDRIPNYPEGIPDKGDIMIWGSAYGQYGHVAVITEATINTFTTFSQNDPLGSLPKIKKYYTYKPVLGWLHPKQKEDNNEQILKDKISDLETKVGTLNQAVASKSLEVNNIRTELETQERDNADLLRQLNEARGQRDQAFREKEELERQIEILKETVDKRDQRVLGLLSKVEGLESASKGVIGDFTTHVIISELLNRLFTRKEVKK